MNQQPIQNIQPETHPQKPLSKTWQIVALTVAGVLVIGGVSFGSYYLWQNVSEKTNQIACTTEARQCADGSYVGRTGPNCEFTGCPSESLPNSSANASPSPLVAAQITDIDCDSSQKFVSKDFNIAFCYPYGKQGMYSSVDDFFVKQVGSKFYLTAQQGSSDWSQTIEVFSKDKNDSLADAIKKKFLVGIFEKDCSVVDNNYTIGFPDSYVSANIKFPQGDDQDPFKYFDKCPQGYTAGTGLAFFMEDKNHPDKFAYLSIGQDVMSLGENKPWYRTVRFLDF